jgi:hypothetical protein
MHEACPECRYYESRVLLSLRATELKESERSTNERAHVRCSPIAPAEVTESPPAGQVGLIVNHYYYHYAKREFDLKRRKISFFKGALGRKIAPIAFSKKEISVLFGI